MTDTLTPPTLGPGRAPLARPVATARRLAAASIAPNTAAAYRAAAAALDRWLAGRALEDASLAAYLAHVFESGRAASTAAQAVKAANFRAKLAGHRPPAGERTARVMAGYRRTAADRGRGQAAPFTAADLAAVLATCPHPRRSGRGTESAAVAAARGRVDGVIAGLLFMAGLRRSEVSAVEWRDVTDATDGAGVLIAVRQSKTNPDGDTADIRYLKHGAARAVRTLRAHRPQWPRGARLGTHRGRRVHDRGDARRELENRPHGGPLQRRGHRRTRGRGHVSVAAGRLTPQESETLGGACSPQCAIPAPLPAGLEVDRVNTEDVCPQITDLRCPLFAESLSPLIVDGALWHFPSAGRVRRGQIQRGAGPCASL